MNAITTFTLKSLRANRVRTLVTIAGVALAAALLTAVLTSFTSLNSMLYRGEAYHGGTWMVEVESSEPDLFTQQANEALANGQISEMGTLQDVGFAQLTPQQQNLYGEYLPIVTISGNVGELCAIRPSSGRLPEAPGEIMLFSTWENSDDQLKLGDTITLQVGQRQAVLASSKPAEASTEDGGESPHQEDPTVYNNHDIEDGTLLDSSVQYQDTARDLGVFNERLVNLQERTYTVVGFYDATSFTGWTSVGMYGYTCDEPTENPIFGFMTMDGVTDSNDVRSRASSLFPNDALLLHTTMLRYMGISTGGAIWDTFFGIVALLSVVIIVSCVSLIYNAFAISVAERSGQFGLLASVGASRRQLRRAVIIEGLTVAVVGIPLGLLIGIGGCAVTFHFLGEGITSLFGSSNVPFQLAVEPGALLLVTGLTLVTVLFSVFVPAWRASRVNVIDALRGRQNQRASKKGEKRATRAANPATLWLRRGIAGRVFGIGGTIARINKKRGTSKGTAASVSLALAIVLLMTAGSLSSFLGTLANVASGGGEPAGDVAITVNLLSPAEERRLNLTDAPAASAPVTAQEVAEQIQNRYARQAALFAEAYEALSATPNAQPVGWRLDSYAPITLDPSMMSNNDTGDGGIGSNGMYNAYALFTYIDDASFNSYAQQLGLNPADYYDPAHPRVIALGKAYGNDGNVYTLVNTVVKTGTAQVTVAGAYEGRAVDGFTVGYQHENGTIDFNISPYLYSKDDDTVSVEVTEEELKEKTQTEVVDIEIAAIADEGPRLARAGGEAVQLILPMSMVSSHAFFNHEPTFRCAFDAPEGQSAELAQDLTDRAGDFFHDQDEFQTSFLYVNDYVGEMNQNQIMATIVNVFCLLFTIILALIAMANVFNTVTNGLILRRREFAVMRSVGLSGRQFRSMITNECVTWCLRGLIPGAMISLVIAYALYRIVGLSLSGLGFSLPWSYVVLAAALTAVTIFASVAYGMHRCKADNLVEALRTDSV